MATQISGHAGKPWWQMPSATRPLMIHERPAKGEYGGECHRIACDHREARWFNETNGHYYCGHCARTFNEVSRRHGQAPLCELHP